MDELDKYDVMDIAWAAGLLEGEATFAKRGPRSIRISCTSVDKDIIEKLYEIFKVGNIYNTKVTVTGKPLYEWSVSSYDNVENILYLILPFMGERRTAKINELLNGQ